jgi:hypothetical protein
MLSDCVISWLYMHVLTLTWENFISLKFSSVFLVFQCGASGPVEFSSSDSSRFGVRTDGILKSERNLKHVRTWAVILVRTGNLIRPDVRNRFAPFRGSARPDVIKTPSGRVPHRGYKLPRSSPSSLILHKIFSLAPCEYVFFFKFLEWSHFLWAFSLSFQVFFFFFCVISFSLFYNC